MLRGQCFDALSEWRHRLFIVDQHFDRSVRNELIELHDALRRGVISFGDGLHECGGDTRSRPVAFATYAKMLSVEATFTPPNCCFISLIRALYSASDAFNALYCCV